MGLLRKAKLSDAKRIHELITFWVKRRRVLDRPLNYIYENLRDFWVYTEEERIVGCCALHVVGWDLLAEIKSLCVDEEMHGRGVGKQLVGKAIEEAVGLEIKKVFALTFVPEFFAKQGFKVIDRKELPHKIWSDCVNCVYFPDCQEQALIISV
ncbi:MAG: N-acetyltransferase [Candidatus Omnitrophica bacterium]|nr:N-acetyltransferase [Candidatus Omnitrophota bacterium]